MDFSERTQLDKTIPSKPEFFTPEQVAGMLQVKETTVRLWLRRGLLRGVKIAHTWRISRTEIDRFDKGEPRD